MYNKSTQTKTKKSHYYKGDVKNITCSLCGGNWSRCLCPGSMIAPIWHNRRIAEEYKKEINDR